jgi:glucose-6-phosphate isomerase
MNFIEGQDSENRAVLHTAIRDFSTQKNPSKVVQEAKEKSALEHKKLKEFVEKIDREKRFSEMIFIGIGGSELGPKALYYGLSFLHRKDRKIHFICNVDPDDVAQTLQNADLKKSLVVVISKSGTTLETATNEEFVRASFIKNGLDPKQHFVSVTMPQTPMDDRTKYLECFHVWDYVGGRYSSTSMVGGVLIAFGIGYQAFYELCQGAYEMDQVALQSDYKKNMPLLLALLGIWNHNFLGYPTLATIPYAQMLFRFPAHLQQCDMESNGKRIDRMGNTCDFQTGPVIWGEPGTNAQHSFYQLIHQGTSVVPLELIGFVESQGSIDFEWKNTTSQEKLLSNLMAQCIALAVGQENKNPNKVFPGNRPSLLLLGKKLTPKALGALLSLYENKIAFQGFIWGVNSFDQEGVQLGKKLGDKCLQLFEAEREGSPKGDFPLGNALLKIVREV